MPLSTTSDHHLTTEIALSLNCYTMQENVSQMTGLMSPNITLLLLSGNHSLDSMLTLRNLSFLEVVANTTSISDTQLQSTELVCSSSGGLGIETICEVYISGLTSYGCTYTVIREVDHFIMEDSTMQMINSYSNVAYLDLHNVRNASLLRITLNSSRQTYSNVVSVYNSIVCCFLSVYLAILRFTTGSPFCILKTALSG